MEKRIRICSTTCVKGENDILYDRQQTSGHEISSDPGSVIEVSDVTYGHASRC